MAISNTRIVVQACLSISRICRGPNTLLKYSYGVGIKQLHISTQRRGLEEFFPKGEDIIEEAEKTGRPWQARELRQKSTEDLHKLWYILLKERNMLQTVKHEAKRVGFRMPAPERMWKVRKSMARIKVVVGERDRAVHAAKMVAESVASKTSVDSYVSHTETADAKDSPITPLETQQAVQR